MCSILLAFSTKQNTIWQLLCLCNDFIMTTSSSLLVYQCLSALRSQNFYTITAPAQYITLVLIQEDDDLCLPLYFLLYCHRNWILIQRMSLLTISSIQDPSQLIVTAIFRQKSIIWAIRAVLTHSSKNYNKGPFYINLNRIIWLQYSVVLMW